MINYTTINHEAREKLGLSWLEYGLADLVYNLSNNPESDYPGWCYASKKKLGEMLGISKQSVHSIINRLIEKGLLEKHKETKHLRITIDWYKEVLIKDNGKESLPLVKKVYFNGKESLLRHGKESLHNKDIINKDINKDIINTPKGVLVKTPLKEKKSSSYGNEQVNHILALFEKEWGYPPTDKQPRRVAWNIARKITAYIKSRGADPNEANFNKTIGYLFERVLSEDWSDNVQTLDVIRRKIPVYLKVSKGGDNK